MISLGFVQISFIFLLIYSFVHLLNFLLKKRVDWLFVLPPLFLYLVLLKRFYSLNLNIFPSGVSVFVFLFGVLFFYLVLVLKGRDNRSFYMDNISLVLLLEIINGFYINWLLHFFSIIFLTIFQLPLIRQVINKDFLYNIALTKVASMFLFVFSVGCFFIDFNFGDEYWQGGAQIILYFFTFFSFMGIVGMFPFHENFLFFLKTGVSRPAIILKLFISILLLFHFNEFSLFIVNKIKSENVRYYIKNITFFYFFINIMISLLGSFFSKTVSSFYSFLVYLNLSIFPIFLSLKSFYSIQNIDQYIFLFFCSSLFLNYLFYKIKLDSNLDMTFTDLGKVCFSKTISFVLLVTVSSMMGCFYLLNGPFIFKLVLEVSEKNELYKFLVILIVSLNSFIFLRFASDLKKGASQSDVSTLCCGLDFFNKIKVVFAFSALLVFCLSLNELYLGR